jgi:hypothetical protein
MTFFLELPSSAMHSSLPIIEFIKGLVLKDFTGSLLNCKQGGNINTNNKKINLEKKNECQ